MDKQNVVYVINNGPLSKRNGILIHTTTTGRYGNKCATEASHKGPQVI